MLKRVQIRGYKSLGDLEVHLHPLSVLFGPNGAGKSNFLDALQLVSRIAASRTLKEAFEPPYRGKPLESFAFNGKGGTHSAESENSSFSIEIDVELSPFVIESVNRKIAEMRSSKGRHEPDEAGSLTTSNTSIGVKETFLRYRIELEIIRPAGFLRVKDEYLAALKNTGEPKKSRRPFLERVKNRLHLRFEGQAHPTYFERHLDHAIVSMPFYPPHYPHLFAMKEELLSWFFFYFEPRVQMRASSPAKEVHHIGLMGEELASFLNTLKVLNPRQFEGIEKALHVIVPSITGIDVRVDEIGEVELRLREGERSVPARVVSEGTLRILGLLALRGARERPALLGLEEPENGVHPRRIQLIAEILRSLVSDSTQVIATTHSPVLLDVLPPESLFVCRKDRDSTKILPFKSNGELLKGSEIDVGLTDEDEQVSARILRGDFDE